MIRLFYFASAALVLSVFLEHAVAQSVSLSPGFTDAASSPRFRDPFEANVDRAPGPSSSDQQLQSERCATLKASSDWVRLNPSRARDRENGNLIDPPRNGADTQRSPDPQRELERQSAILGCPTSTQK